MNQHKKFLDKELGYRLSGEALQRAISLPLSEKKASLKSYVLQERKILYNAKELQEADQLDQVSLARAEDTPLCQMHGKICMTETLVDTLYHHAMDRYSNEPGVEVDKKKATANGITEICQTKVFGRPDRIPPYVNKTYVMPLNKASGRKWEVVKQSMMGSQANQMLKGLPELIKYIFSPDNDEQGKNITQIRGKNSKKEQDWYRVSAKFVECMNTMEEHDNIQGETLEDLEDKCNEFIHQ